MRHEDDSAEMRGIKGTMHAMLSMLSERRGWLMRKVLTDELQREWVATFFMMVCCKACIELLAKKEIIRQ